jgi:hypothetical protein
MYDTVLYKFVQLASILSTSCTVTDQQKKKNLIVQISRSSTEQLVHVCNVRYHVSCTLHGHVNTGVSENGDIITAARTRTPCVKIFHLR